MGLAFGLFAAGAMFGAWTWFAGATRDISAFQIVHQDLLVLVLGAALLAFLLEKRPAFVRPAAVEKGRGFVFACAVFALIAGYAGAYLAALNFPLSLDEFMVTFDAAIFRGGHVLAPVAPEWQPLVRGLQPMFMFETKAPFWGSGYMPVNAALHAAMSVVDSALTAPLLAALSVLLLFDIARRVWPQRPDAAIVAVLLLVTSAQFVVTAMTPYAMTAHLAFNLLWLWLFLRNTGASHGGAILIGFAATGLHQVAFHPLFAAPFVLSLWLGRRWRLAALYTVGYGAIGLFWILYHSLLISDVSGSGGGAGIPAFLAHVAAHVRMDLAPLVLFMPRNFARFIAWQNPFTIVLVCLALANIRRWAFPLPQLLAGIVLTLLLMIAVMPYQGHGWGYRYLHGLIGSIVLIGTFAWVQFTGAEAARMRTALIVCSVFALSMLPVRAWQMRSFTEPYARATEAIAKTDADLVFVDPSDIWFGGDFARNDPYLRKRPKIFILNYMNEDDIARLCAENSVALFDVNTARTYGVPTLDRKSAHNEKLRALMAQRGCGKAL